MNYRPEGLNAEEIWDEIDDYKTATELIELGFDKMLEALKKESILEVQIFKNGEWIKGYLVIIPEE